MQIRAYRPTDWSRLCDIHDAARRDELHNAGLSDAFLTLQQTAQSEGLFDGELAVIEDHAQILGFVAFCEGELTWLYIDPAFYRRGLGRQLVRYAMRASPQGVTVEVLAGNEAALSLYSSEGFRVVKRVDGRLTGNEQFAASGLVMAWQP